MRTFLTTLVIVVFPSTQEIATIFLLNFLAKYKVIKIAWESSPPASQSIIMLFDFGKSLGKSIYFLNCICSLIVG